MTSFSVSDYVACRLISISIIIHSILVSQRRENIVTWRIYRFESRPLRNLTLVKACAWPLCPRSLGTRTSGQMCHPETIVVCLVGVAQGTLSGIHDISNSKAIVNTAHH